MGEFEVGDETAEDRVAREAAEAQAQRTAREGDFTREGIHGEQKATPTPSEHERDEDQPPVKKPRAGKKSKVSTSAAVASWRRS